MFVSISRIGSPSVTRALISLPGLSSSSIFYFLSSRCMVFLSPRIPIGRGGPSRIFMILVPPRVVRVTSQRGSKSVSTFTGIVALETMDDTVLRSFQRLVCLFFLHQFLYAVPPNGPISVFTFSSANFDTAFSVAKAKACPDVKATICLDWVHCWMTRCAASLRPTCL